MEHTISVSHAFSFVTKYTHHFGPPARTGLQLPWAMTPVMVLVSRRFNSASVPKKEEVLASSTVSQHLMGPVLHWPVVGSVVALVGTAPTAAMTTAVVKKSVALENILERKRSKVVVCWR